MNWRRIASRLAGLALLGLALLFLAAWVAAGQLVAPVNANVGPLAEDWAYESLTLESGSGSSIAAWYVPANNATATVVLLHPLDGNRLSMLGRAKLLHNAGYALVLIDMQAHGESPGQAITCGYLERYDVKAAVAFARSKNPDHRIGVLGRSLGGAAAVLGSPLGIDALVLEAVYPTIDEAVSDRIRIRLGPLCHVLTPLLTWQFRPRLGISTSELRPIDHIADAGCPVLILAGDLDQHTTVAESYRLYEAASEPKHLVVFPAAPHGDLQAFDPKLYSQEVLGFLQKSLRGEAAGPPGVVDSD